MPAKDKMKKWLSIAGVLLVAAGVFCLSMNSMSIFFLGVGVFSQ